VTPVPAIIATRESANQPRSERKICEHLTHYPTSHRSKTIRPFGVCRAVTFPTPMMNGSRLLRRRDVSAGKPVSMCVSSKSIRTSSADSVRREGCRQTSKGFLISPKRSFPETDISQREPKTPSEAALADHAQNCASRDTQCSIPSTSRRAAWWSAERSAKCALIALPSDAAQTLGKRELPIDKPLRSRLRKTDLEHPSIP
jgi:hypothetical protein